MELLDDEAQVEARFGPFGDSANIDERQVPGLRRTYHRLKKSFQMHPMLHIGDEAQAKARFGPFEDSANLDARQVYGWRRTYHRLKDHFGRTLWNSQVTWVMWNLTSFRLETV